MTVFFFAMQEDYMTRNKIATRTYFAMLCRMPIPLKWRRVHIPRWSAPPIYTRVRCAHCRGTGTITTVNGQWLKWKREHARLDQRTLGATLGVSGPYLSDIENNRRVCPVEIEAAYRALKRAPRS
jgi:hypothetical protein